MPLSESESVTLGAALIGYIRFEVRKLALQITLKGVSCNNETRPNADPRKALVWVGTRKDSEGTDDSDGKIASGYVSVNGDLVKLMPTNFNLGSSSIVGFRFEGENGDICNAKILYKLI